MIVIITIKEPTLHFSLFILSQFVSVRDKDHEQPISVGIAKEETRVELVEVFPLDHEEKDRLP
jgi:hypothetical protein